MCFIHKNYTGTLPIAIRDWWLVIWSRLDIHTHAHQGTPSMFARARRSGISIQIAPMSSTTTLWVRPGISARTRPITIDVGCLSDGIIVVTRTLKIIIDNNDGACARDDDRLDALDYVCVCVQLLYAHFIIPVVCGGGLRATSNTATQTTQNAFNIR